MTREQVCEHVEVSIRDYFEAKFKHSEEVREEQNLRIEQALIASRAAVEKAEKAQERRLDLLNEFRAQAADESKKYALRETVDRILLQLGQLGDSLSAQIGRLMPRDEYSQRHIDLEKQIATVEKQIARLYGGLMVVAFVGIANLVKIWFTH